MSHNRSERKILLPQCQALLDFPERRASSLEEAGKEVLCVCSGIPPATDWLCEVAKGRDLWCVDGGADICRQAGLLPDYFLGDADSVGKMTLDWIKDKNVPCLFLPREKNLTDYQVALEQIKLRTGVYKTLIVTGVWGGRFDHLHSIVFSSGGFLKENTSPVIVLGDAREVLFFVGSGARMELQLFRSPKALSLIPLEPRCQGVCSEGTKWDLHDSTLLQDRSWAVSNEVFERNSGKIAPTCSVSLEKGFLGVYMWWEDFFSGEEEKRNKKTGCIKQPD